MLNYSGCIELPEHIKPGGFDHADIHVASRRVYLAHTCNNSLDVIDCAGKRYSHSIPDLGGVAGALVSGDMVFTSNRGDNTVGVLQAGEEGQLAKIPVGVRPNGLAFDPGKNLLLAANVGDPNILNSYTLSMVDVTHRKMIHSIQVPGRTRWTIFDPQTDSFYINIADPAQIAVVFAENPDRVARVFPIPAAGPHGLDLDATHRRLFCACDTARLLTVGLPEGEIQTESALSGPPDVIFHHPKRHRLYVAIGDPGVVDVFDTTTMARVQMVETEKGAHTLALDKAYDQVYVFLPQTHSAAIFTED